jgi:hypothetical protein
MQIAGLRGRKSVASFLQDLQLFETLYHLISDLANPKAPRVPKDVGFIEIVLSLGSLKPSYQRLCPSKGSSYVERC